MSEIATKSRILDNAGYVHHFGRDVYVNRTAKKVLSVEFVEDHNEDELRKCIGENSSEGEWRFYFNSPPLPQLRCELAGVLG